MLTSMEMSLKIPSMGSIRPNRFRLVAAAALCCLVTLYPSPSPLFHLLFLPSLIVNEKYDKWVCSTLALILSVVSSITLYAKTNDSAVESAITAPPLTVVLLTLIYTHRKVTALCQSRAWVKAVSFGILLSACSMLVTSTAPGGGVVSFSLFENEGGQS